jgi:hypothetical protein
MRQTLEPFAQKAIELRFRDFCWDWWCRGHLALSYWLVSLCRPGPSMLPLQRFEGLLIGLWFYIINRFFRRAENAVPKTYLAYSIGPEMLAIAVRELEAQNDEAALSEATPLFHDGLKRIEVWCGSRKVGDVPARPNENYDGGAVRESA